jgi:hypothetical protein
MAALENLESSIGSNILMRVTFPVFPGATSAKPTARRLLAGREEQRRGKKTIQFLILKLISQRALFAATS